MPANDDQLLFGKLFYLVAVLDLVDENLGGLEAGDIVLIDHDCGVARDISGDFLLPLLIDKATESPDVDILAARHRRFDNAEERLYGGGHIGLVNSCLFSDLGDNVCLGHGLFRLRVSKIQDGKFKRRMFKRKMYSFISLLTNSILL